MANDGRLDKFAVDHRNKLVFDRKLGHKNDIPGSG